MFGSFPPSSFVVHVTQYEGRTLERLLAPRDPGVESLALGGAVIEADYVRRDPVLLARLAESRIPWVMDPQSVRFSTPRFASTRLAGLRYAPDSPLDASRMTSRVEAMVRDAMEFQAEAEPTMYVVPSLALVRSSQATFRTFAEIHHLASDINGRDVPYRPLLASAYPGRAVLRGRFSVFERLDRTYAGAYVLPLKLEPRRDSVESLVSYARFLENAQNLGLSVIAGRAGVFGLVLAAFGIDNFDSGLGERESFNLSRLDYERKQRPDGSRNGGRQRRVYVRQLRTVLPSQDVEALLAIKGLQAQLLCDIGECRFAGVRYAIENPREHFMHARAAELDELRARKTPALRVQLVNDWLRTAIESARLVNRMRGELGMAPLGFDHLETWRGVLTWVATPVATGP